jgi:hypothetical protein
MPPQHDAPEALVLAGAFTARAAGAGVFFSACGTALLLPAQQQDVPEAGVLIMSVIPSKEWFDEITLDLPIVGRSNTFFDREVSPHEHWTSSQGGRRFGQDGPSL